MLQPFEAVFESFAQSTGWNSDNAYSSLDLTPRALLHFDTPLGLHVNVASLASPHYALAYRLSAFGMVDGTIGYLYSSRALEGVKNSTNVGLREVVRGYRTPGDLVGPPNAHDWEIWHGGKRVDRKDTLLYGRMYLPISRLEAMLVRRLSPTRQLSITSVSDHRLPNRGTLTARLQQDHGKWGMEYLYSTDEALLGVKGLYNFGFDPRKSSTVPPKATPSADVVGRWSAGAELYYVAVNKAAGMSMGLRYVTLPTHPGTPVTMTLQWNPIMGHISATYSVQGGVDQAYSTQLDFNMFSYESELAIGCELWQRRRIVTKEESEYKDGNVLGVLKGRISRQGLGVLWEGKYNQSVLFNVGANFNPRSRKAPINTVGLELQYSS